MQTRHFQLSTISDLLKITPKFSDTFSTVLLEDITKLIQNSDSTHISNFYVTFLIHLWANSAGACDIHACLNRHTCTTPESCMQGCSCDQYASQTPAKA